MKALQYSLILLTSLVTLACTEPASAYENIDADKLMAQITQSEAGKNVVILDVRTPEEHRAGRIPGTNAHADWYNWGDEVGKVMPRLQQADEVVVYCRSGGRSSKAAKWLSDRGIKQVRNLVGGIGGWSKAGHPVER